MSFASRLLLLMSCILVSLFVTNAVAETASEPVDIKFDIICNEHFAIKITKSATGLSYYAWDLSNWKPEPSLTLYNGISYDGKTATHYEFKNSNYTYTIWKTFPGRGGDIYLTVDKSGKRLYTEQCRSITSADTPED